MLVFVPSCVHTSTTKDHFLKTVESLEYLYETKNGKMLLKKLTKVYDENNQECRARIHRGEGLFAESKWEAVEQGEGVMSIAAPIAYINESTMESFLFSKMTKKRAKAIATEISYHKVS